MSGGGGKKRRGLSPKRHVGINVTPMIDLMMCLIIFFLLAATLSADELDYNVMLPKIRQAKKVDFDKLGDRLMVNVMPAAPEKGIKAAIFTVRGHVTEVAQLDKMLADAVRKNPKVRLAVRPDSKVIYDDIQKLLFLAAKQQVAEVMFAAANAGDPTHK